MSLTLQPLMSGNAVRVFVAPAATASKTRVLRNTSGVFTGPSDPGAYLVHEGDAHAYLDLDALVNGTTYHYHAWDWIAGAWVDAGGASAVPSASYQDASVDAFTLLRDRLIAGLAVEVAAGRLSHPQGVIEVRTAPPQTKDQTLPIVTLQLSADAPADRYLGEDLQGESDWPEHEGWFSSVRCEVIGWSFNPDERIALRQALKRIVLANLEVFDAGGMLRVEFSQQDAEEMNPEVFGAPVYMTNGTFSCLASSEVEGGSFVTIADIPVTATPFFVDVTRSL